MRAHVLAVTIFATSTACTLQPASPSLHNARPLRSGDAPPSEHAAAIHGLRAGDGASIATRDGKRYVGSVASISETDVTLDVNGREKILLWDSIAEANRIDADSPSTPRWLNPSGTGGTIK